MRIAGMGDDLAKRLAKSRGRRPRSALAWADNSIRADVAEVEFDTFREIFRSPSVVHGVVAEGFGEGFAGGFGFVGERDFDSFDKDVGVSAAEAWSRTGSGFGVWG